MSCFGSEIRLGSRSIAAKLFYGTVILIILLEPSVLLRSVPGPLPCHLHKERESVHKAGVGASCVVVGPLSGELGAAGEPPGSDPIVGGFRVVGSSWEQPSIAGILSTNVRKHTEGLYDGKDCRLADALV